MKQFSILAAALFFAACAHSTSGPIAAARLEPTTGNTARGTVKMQEVSEGIVRVTVNLSGVPAGTHGFHIHEKGDCGDNGNAAGGHFNPHGSMHGDPMTSMKHSGDFGNVIADERGVVRTTFDTRAVTLIPGMMSAIGHAVILHANADDLKTQPTGNAGGRIACGVIGLQ